MPSKQQLKSTMNTVALRASVQPKKGSLGPFGIAVLADGTLSELIPVYFYIAKSTDGGLATHVGTDKLR